MSALLLLVIEGSDKAGKLTQACMLSKALINIGYKSKVISFPDYSTHIGKEIEAFLNSKRDNYPLQVRHMLLSANRWEKKVEIEQACKEYDIVILNRYYQSNIVYGLANGLDLQWLEMLDKGLPKEDMVIVLDVSAETAIERASKNALHKDSFENINMLRIVSMLYKQLASKYGWIVIDGERSIQEVHNDILTIVLKRIKHA